VHAPRCGLSAFLSSQPPVRCCRAVAASVRLSTSDARANACRPAAGRRGKRPCVAGAPAALGAAVACAGAVLDLGIVEAVLAAAVSGSACPPRRERGDGRSAGRERCTLQRACFVYVGLDGGEASVGMYVMTVWQCWAGLLRQTVSL